jgi:hypothetical protein
MFFQHYPVENRTIEESTDDEQRKALKKKFYVPGS